MKKYFMIKEFAKLRNVHINSLLYYEKLGLLKPAYVNPLTKYRYYQAEQLPVLDIILMCIKLGIPLKEMKEYIDENGNLKFRELLDYGQMLAKKKMEEIQTNLNMIERSLELISDNLELNEEKGVYSRTIEERHILISDFFDTPGDVSVVESETVRLYEKAQKYGFTPLLPTGILLHYIENSKIRYCIFLEIISKGKENPQMIVIPKGEFPCVKVDLNASSKLVKEIGKHWEWEQGMTVLVQNMYSDKYNFGSKPSEFQKVQIALDL